MGQKNQSSKTPTTGKLTTGKASKTATKTATAKAPSSRRRPRGAVLRRPPEKGLPRLQYNLSLAWQSGLEQWPVWALLFMVVAVWALLPRQFFQLPRVEEGALATRTYVANRDISIENESETERLKKNTASGVAPVYDFDTSLAVERRAQLRDLFETGRRILAEQAISMDGDAGTPTSTATPKPTNEAASVEDLSTLLVAASGLKLSAEEALWFQQRKYPATLEERLKNIAGRILTRGVVANKAFLLGYRDTGIEVRKLPSGQIEEQLDLFSYLEYPDQVRDAVAQELRGAIGLDSQDQRLLADFLLANVVPNLTPNRVATQEKRDAAVEEVGTVTQTLRKGEVIVRQGEVVDEVDAQAIATMADARDRSELGVAGLGAFLLAGAALSLIWIVAGYARRRDRSRVRLFSECLILLALHVAVARFGFFVATALAGSIPSQPWGSVESIMLAIPFAALGLLGVLLYGRVMAAVLILVFAFLAGRIVGGELDWTITFYALTGSLAAIFALDVHHFKSRSVMIRAGWITGLANVGSVMILSALGGEVPSSFAEVGFAAFCAFLGGFLAAAAASFAVPIFESLFALTTYVKLLELANPNLPLLRRLAFEAPGTFQHSLAVANLAKAGSEAIGIDAVLVHTAALYHDVGKILRPQYFVENQAPGQNPHDKIQPTMSALILVNHVKEGVELALKHRLPQPILDAIAEHHGTRLITFFYKRAVERRDPDTDGVREEDFRYPGPKPQSKEMGILMLADGVEAASRTLIEPSRQKIRGLIRTILNDCLEDRQLDHTDLTLGDLRRVEEAFLGVLSNIYHRRIDYPGFDFNQPGQGAAKEKAEREKTGDREARKTGDDTQVVVPPEESGKIDRPRSGPGGGKASSTPSPAPGSAKKRQHSASGVRENDDTIHERKAS